MRKIHIGRKNMLIIQVALILILMPLVISAFNWYPSPRLAAEQTAKEEGFLDSREIGSVRQGDCQILFHNKANWTMVSFLQRHSYFFWYSSGSMCFDRNRMKTAFDYYIYTAEDAEAPEKAGDRAVGVLFGLIGDSQVDRIEALLADGTMLHAQILDGGVFYIRDVPGQYVKVPAPNAKSDDSIQLQWQIKALSGYDKKGTCVKTVTSFDPMRNDDINLPVV